MRDEGLYRIHMYWIARGIGRLGIRNVRIPSDWREVSSLRLDIGSLAANKFVQSEGHVDRNNEGDEEERDVARQEQELLFRGDGDGGYPRGRRCHRGSEDISDACERCGGSGRAVDQEQGVDR